MLHEKIKRRLIAQYLTDAGGKQNMTDRDWFLLGRGIEWRLRTLDGLLASVQTGELTRQQLQIHIHAIAIRRQIEEDLTAYHDRLDDLTEQLQDGEITPEQYESRVEEIAIAILILAFLLGRGGDDEDNLSADERAIVASAQAILSGGGGTGAALQTAFDDLDIDDAAKESVGEAIALAGESTAGLAEYMPDATDEGMAARIMVWVTAALGLYTRGQLFASGDVRYEWQVGPTEHCADCARLNGQIHTAEEWRRSRFQPQGRALACGGWNCQCALIETTDAVRGNF